MSLLRAMSLEGRGFGTRWPLERGPVVAGVLAQREPLARKRSKRAPSLVVFMPVANIRSINWNSRGTFVSRLTANTDFCLHPSVAFPECAWAKSASSPSLPNWVTAPVVLAVLFHVSKIRVFLTAARVGLLTSTDFDVPANAALVFDVELLEIKGAKDEL